MSSIAGIYALDEQLRAQPAVECMLEHLACRGDDSVGSWSEPRVSLGHRGHWTTLEQVGEEQPLLSEDGLLCLVADARLDNREELRTALIGTGRFPRETTDAELILQSYDAWGEDCPRHLLGDFAFALWDGRNRRLFCRP